LLVFHNRPHAHDGDQRQPIPNAFGSRRKRRRSRENVALAVVPFFTGTCWNLNRTVSKESIRPHKPKRSESRAAISIANSKVVKER
jgi:hypothetical protein